MASWIQSLREWRLSRMVRNWIGLDSDPVHNKSAFCAQLSVEALEDRHVPSTFGVQLLGDAAITTTRSDNPQQSTTAGDLTISNFEVAAGEQRLLVVGATIFAGFEQEQGDITAVYFGDQLLTQATQARFTSRLTKSDAEFWYLHLGDSNTSTTADITFEGTGHDFQFAGAQVFSGVDPDNPVKNTRSFRSTSPTSSSLSVGSNVGDLVLDLFFTTTPGRVSVAGDNQTVIINEENIAATFKGRADDVAISIQEGGLNDPMSWTIESSQTTIIHHIAFAIQQQNFAPEAVGTIPDVEVLEGAADSVLDLSGFFSDYERDVELSGIDLKYSVLSSDPGLVSAAIDNGNDLSTLDFSSLGIGTATITITATDHLGETAEHTFDVVVSPSQVSFEVTGEEIIREGDTDQELTFTITKTGSTNLSSSVSYALGGTATNGTDYFATASGTITFAPEESQKTVTIQVSGDDLAETDESVSLTLSSPSASGNGTAALGNTISAVKTLTNDDFLPVPDAGGPYAIDEGSSLVLNGSASTDADSNALTFRWDVDGDGDFDENVTGVAPTLSAADLAALGLSDNTDAPILITLEVSDGTQVSTAQTTLKINNVAPVLNAGGDEVLPLAAFGAFSRPGATFNDPGPDTWTGTVNYGDGSGDQILNIDPSTRSFDLSHTYATAGTYTVTVTITDDDGGVGSSTFVVEVQINTAPVSQDDQATTTESNAIQIDVLANDTDQHNNIDPIQTVNLSSPSLGSLRNNGNGTFTYDPNGELEFLGAGETAQVSFEYQIVDDFGETDTGTVTITVQGENDQPILTPASLVTNEDAGLFVIDLLSTLDAMDLDAGDTLTVIEVSVVSPGDFTFTRSDNLLEIETEQFSKLSQGETEEIIFEVTVSDQNGGLNSEAMARITLTVEGQNDSPTTTGSIADIVVSENAPDSLLDLSGLFSDPDLSDSLTLSVTSSNPALVTASIEGNSLRLTYTPEQNGIATITVTATDPFGASVSVTAQVTVLSAPEQQIAFLGFGSSGDLFGNPTSETGSSPNGSALAIALEQQAFFGTADPMAPTGNPFAQTSSPESTLIPGSAPTTLQQPQFLEGGRVVEEDAMTEWLEWLEAIDLPLWLSFLSSNDAEIDSAEEKASETRGQKGEDKSVEEIKAQPQTNRSTTQHPAKGSGQTVELAQEE